MEIALLGFGAIGRLVATRLRPGIDPRVGAVLTRSPVPQDVRAATAPEARYEQSLEPVLAARPRLVLECAGHGGLEQHGARVLESGIDLGVVSTGALADRALHERLLAAAAAGKARLHVIAGALGGVDAIAAAATMGLEAVRYRSRKPPAAWKGTRAERLIDLAAVREATPFQRGDARQAALDFPQNANVVATIALAAGGFDLVEVELVADPQAGGNIHELEVRGAFGEMSVRMRGVPLPDNPKTSTLAALSALRLVRSLSSPQTL